MNTIIFFDFIIVVKVTKNVSFDMNNHEFKSMFSGSKITMQGGQSGNKTFIYANGNYVPTLVIGERKGWYQG